MMSTMLLRKETGTVLLMLHQVMMVTSYGGITACYSPPDSMCSSHFLTDDSFGASDRIAIERLYYGRKPSTVTKESCDCNTTCCIWNVYGGPAMSRVPFSIEDRLSVYRNCSHEFSCVIRSPYSPNTGYDYVVYQFTSLWDGFADDIMSITNITDTGWHYLYFAGKSTPIRDLSCSCDINGGVDLDFHSHYINLNRESCSRVKITADNKPVYNCTEDGVYISYNDILIYDLKEARIEFIDMTSDYDDAIWIGFFQSEAVNYSCDCSRQVMNGGWSDWSYGSCSVSCGSGHRVRSRKCNAPTPTNGGTNCIGSRTEEVECTEQECSFMDGGWSGWSNSSCSVSCGSGIRTRSRECNTSTGTNCVGSRSEDVECKEQDCPFEGSWSDWSYSACSASCGGGTRTRIRKCNMLSSSSGGQICSGETSDDIPCGEQACPEAALYIAPWVLFGVCLLINIFTLIWCIIRLKRRKLKQKMSGQVRENRLPEINRNESLTTTNNAQSVYYENTVINQNNYESLSPTLSDEYGAYASLK